MSYRDNIKEVLANNLYLVIAAAWAVTIAFIVDNYWSGTSTPEIVRKTIQNDIQKKQKDFEKFCKDSNLVKKLAANQYNEATLEQIKEKKYFICIYKENNCVFWNTEVAQPDSSIIKSPDVAYSAKLSNGWYIVDKRTVASQNNSLKIISLIPVKWDYYVSNKYLKNSFTAASDLENDYDISQTAGLLVKSLKGNTLFYLQVISSNRIAHNNIISLWLKIIAALLVLMFIHIAASFVAAKQGLRRGFIVLFVPVLLLRILSYYIPIPLNFRQLELFDPAVYGSNFILRSLGDLLINSLIFVWLVLFVRYNLKQTPFNVNSITRTRKIGTVVGISLIMILLTFLCGHIIRSLVADSQISFDVINFFTLNIYSVVGFIVLCCIATGYFFLFQILSYTLNPFIKDEPYIIYFTLCVLGLLVLTFSLGSSYVSFDLLLLLWLLLFVFLMDRNYRSLFAARVISSVYVFWIFFFSISITATIVSENRKKELDLRKRFAENLSNKADVTSEAMLNGLITDINNGVLTPIFSQPTSESQNRAAKDSLIDGSLSSYVNKYDTRIYTFDAKGNPLFNSDSATINTLNTIIETQAKSIKNGLYYYDVSYDRFDYLIKKEITDTDNVVKGYVFILSNPKKYKSDALYPELFSKGSSNSIENSSVYAFAVYNNNQLSISHNDYAFPTKISKPRLLNNEFSTTKRYGYDELWYRADGQKVIVITKPDSFFIESITLFAYLFCSFLALTALFIVLNILIEKKFDFNKITLLSDLSIRTQIHGTIILVSIFSFLIIGVTTILFFINRYHNNNREKLSRVIQVMQKEVRESLQKVSTPAARSNSFTFLPTKSLESDIMKVSEIYSADVNIYDLNGNLQVSSLPLPYDEGIVSKKMDPTAFYHLKKLKDVQFFQEQKIGKLTYLSNYVPVRNETGSEFAYLNIPYFESENKLEEEISNFLVTIINLNAFIFLIAGIIALFITNRVTRSFSLISEKMKKVNLGTINEMISWNKKDEIGELVEEYNKMVRKLDTSAELLAKSEREGAWREMARQVAHEIKNPLTPMRLNLQYLQKAIDSNSPNVKEISVYVAKILVEQIDHLSQIASDFAQFANLGQSKNQLFNLTDSLKQVTSLYSSNEKLHITMRPHSDTIMIRADKTQINRLFTNLLQNAIESVPEEKNAEIKIATNGGDGKVLVKITDNGKGIPAYMKNKIFTPNFTTKSSGTGLGLAMCKGIVEKSNGNIWFETIDGESTTFFVQLPLAG